MLVTRYVDPDAGTRYGNMVYVRCGPWGNGVPSGPWAVTIWPIPGCATSRRVLAQIRADGIEAGFIVEYLKDPPPRRRNRAALKEMGIGPRELLRRRGTPSMLWGSVTRNGQKLDLYRRYGEAPALDRASGGARPQGLRGCAGRRIGYKDIL